MEIIKKQFDKVLAYSQNINTPQTDELFEQWKNKKIPVFKDLFKENEYIYEYPREITVDIDENTLSSMYSNFLNKLEYSNLGLYDFVKDMKDCFYENKTDKDYVYKDTVIKKGIKIIKAFKYFIEDKEVLERYQNEASTLIQKTKVTGKLCLSIHPLDFLSLSENCHNWRSCHSLDGAYRAGNLSYMADACTLICYIKANDNNEYVPYNFPSDVKWNSKKWRMLLFISQDQNMMFAGRQYPFSLGGDILEEISKALQFSHNYSVGLWTGWDNSYITEFPTKLFPREPIYLEEKYLLGYNGQLIGLNDLIIEPHRALHYNDLKHSSIYAKPYYRYRITPYPGFPMAWTIPNQKPLVIGSNVKCIHCGEKHIDKMTEEMLCEDCFNKLSEGMMTCEYCNHSVPRDEIMEVDDCLICPDCYATRVKICARCGEQCFDTDGQVSLEDNQFYCNRCITKMRKEKQN